MNILAYTDLLMWLAIVALVVLTVRTAMMVNKFFIHRANRRALAELRKAAMMSEQAHAMRTRAVADESDKTPEHVQGF